ncbi:MAG TPA: hypothetical protein DD827_04275 [Gammaproteobacteria bacterium]|jgi:Ca-activated chloride channel family protein|nr:hypothetical protein [Gammaproteobacteria bacterium]
MTYQLVWPWMALALPLPLLMRWLLPRAQDRSGGVLFAPFATSQGSDSRMKLSTSKRWRKLLALLVWLLLVAASMGPERLDEAVELPREGRNIMLAVDVSGSMQTPDMDPSKRRDRLDVVKEVASEFIRRREGDRTGLILFGSRPYIQAPLTFDRETVQTLMQESVVGIAGQETAIGDAIGLAIKRLHTKNQNETVLILLTDGSNTTGQLKPRQAARLAKQVGLKIYTIGVGGEPVVGQDIFGRPITTYRAELDEDALKYIADTTGGQYFRATDKGALRSIYSLLDQLEPAAGKGETLRPVSALYFWPLSAAFLLSLLLGLPMILESLSPKQGAGSRGVG